MTVNPIIILGFTLIAGLSLARFILLLFDDSLKEKGKVLLQNYDFAFFGVIGLLVGLSFTGTTAELQLLQTFTLFAAHIMFLASLGRMVFYYHLIKPFQQKPEVNKFYEKDLNEVEM